MPSPQKLVRIKPGSPRDTHVFKGYHFKKADGWYKVPTSIADECAREPLFEGNPDTSPLLFDVKEQDEAMKTAELERARVEPPGTADKPKEISPSGPTVAEAPRTAAAGVEAERDKLAERERELVAAGRDLDEYGDNLRKREEVLAAKERELAAKERELAAKASSDETHEGEGARTEAKGSTDKGQKAPKAKDAPR